MVALVNPAAVSAESRKHHCARMSSSGGRLTRKARRGYGLAPVSYVREPNKYLNAHARRRLTAA